MGSCKFGLRQLIIVEYLSVDVNESPNKTWKDLLTNIYN
jgi:hypothetical protein